MRWIATLLLFAGTARADLVYTADVTTPPAVLSIPVEISGGSDLQALALGLRLTSGEIAGITYDTGTIWEGLPLLTFEGVPLPSFETIANVVVNQINTGTTADGTAMWLELDLRGVDPGVVSLDLDAGGLSEAAGPFGEPVPLSFRSGQITVVPEPAASVLVGAVVCLVLIGMITGRVFA